MEAEFLYYNRWANLQLFEACLSLTPDQLERKAPGAYGTIYETLIHLASSEVNYYRRLSGITLRPSFNWDDRPSLAEIQAFSEQVSSAIVETAEKVRKSDFFERTWNDAEWDGTSTRLKSVGMLIQVVQHGIEHRTNITTILAQMDIEAPDLSGWEYMRLNQNRMGV